MATKQLLKELSTGVGGSEAHHLFSLEPYGCRRQLWYAKTGHAPDFPFRGNNDTERGTHLEAIVAKIYAEATGRHLTKSPCARHPTEQRLLAHPDRTITDAKRPRSAGVLEIKCPTVRGFSRVKREGLPDSWILQLQHTMHAACLDWGAYAVFSAELWQLVEFDIESDHDLGDRLRGEVREFWAQVAKRDAPTRLPASDRRCATCPFRTTCQGQLLLDLKAAAGEPGDDLEEDESLAPLVREYVQARDLAKDAGELKDEAEGRLKEAIGDRLRLKTSDAKLYHGVIEKRTIDAKALREDYPDLASRYERKSVYRSLRVYPL